jgi:hypothetical protein
MKIDGCEIFPENISTVSEIESDFYESTLAGHHWFSYWFYADSHRISRCFTKAFREGEASQEFQDFWNTKKMKKHKGGYGWIDMYMNDYKIKPIVDAGKKKAKEDLNKIRDELLVRCGE